MKNYYKIADLNVLIEYKYNYTYKFLENYLSNDTASYDLYIKVSDDELDAELKKSGAERVEFVENTCILRALSYNLLKSFNGFLFHASAISYENKAYLFTAKSGVGKSTHTALLKEYLQDKIAYINDDKPFIRYFEDENVFYVYGSPWCGKHWLSSNVKVPLNSIIKIERGLNSEVCSMDEISSLQTLFEQTDTSNYDDFASSVLELFNKLLAKTKFYNLKCVKDIESAKYSFENILNR